MSSLVDRVILVTGASAGIGEATARRLAREGARVVLTARRLERLLTVKQEIESALSGHSEQASGLRSLAVAADVTVEEERERLVRKTLDTFGRIDGLVNNAGYGQRGPIEIVPLEKIRQNFETNFFSLIALTQKIIPVMRKQRCGRIINVGSVAGRIARPLTSIYDATKHAVEAITDGLRGELAPFGIQVVLIEPGYILTEFAKVASAIQPTLEEAAPYASFLEEYQRRQEKTRNIAGHPNEIAELIFQALTVGRPRFRYAAPRHAHVFLALKRFLPERLFEYFSLKQMGIEAHKLSAKERR